MKRASIRSSLLVSVAASVLAAAAAPARAAPVTSKQAIRPILAQMMRAAAAHDTGRFMAPFLHASSLVFVFDGVFMHGWNTLYRQQRKWWQHGRSDVRYRLDHPVEFMALAPGAEVTTLRMSARRVLPNRTVSASAFVVTYIWRRLPGGWRIVYGHESWVNPPH
jgi:hypothetical protein